MLISENMVFKKWNSHVNLNILKVRRSTINKYNSNPFISVFAHLQSRIS